MTILRSTSLKTPSRRRPGSSDLKIVSDLEPSACLAAWHEAARGFFSFDVLRTTRPVPPWSGACPVPRLRYLHKTAKIFRFFSQAPPADVDTPSVEVCFEIPSPDRMSRFAGIRKGGQYGNSIESDANACCEAGHRANTPCCLCAAGWRYRARRADIRNQSRPRKDEAEPGPSHPAAE